MCCNVDNDLPPVLTSVRVLAASSTLNPCCLPVALPCLQLHLPVLLLGDVVISLDTAERQAEERGWV